MKTFEVKTLFVDDIAWEKLYPKILPEAKSSRAAGYDVIAVGEPKIIGEREPMTNLWKRVDYIEYRTGIKIDPQNSSEDFTHVLIFPRSSVSKYNLVLANSIGLIDNDYRGEILLRFKYIWQPEDYVISRDKIKDNGTFMLGVVGQVNWEKIYRTGERIGQLVSLTHNSLEFVEGERLTDTQRGEGGFQSTGK